LTLFFILESIYVRLLSTARQLSVSLKQQSERLLDAFELAESFVVLELIGREKKRQNASIDKAGKPLHHSITQP